VSGGGRVTEGWRPCGEAAAVGESSEMEDAMMMGTECIFPLSSDNGSPGGAKHGAKVSDCCLLEARRGERQGDWLRSKQDIACPPRGKAAKALDTALSKSKISLEEKEPTVLR